MADRNGNSDLLWILAVFLLMVVLGVLFLPGLISRNTNPLVCGTNVKGLGTALYVYAFDYNNKFPAENWCDLLMLECDVQLESLLCPYSDCVEGESSYALNLAAAELGTTAPPDMVVAFETSAGRSGQREILKEPRKFQTLFKDMKIGEVYKDRWNQIGGPELLSLENHNGEGANFLFGDGHAEFVRAHRLTELQWNKDDTVKLTEADVQRLVKQAKEAKK